jgi:hypothetical protein
MREAMSIAPQCRDHKGAVETNNLLAPVYGWF